MAAIAGTLTERTKKRLPHPTARQMAAATEILERAQGKDARADTLAPFVADGLVTLHDRLDRAQLTEERLLGTIANALDARRTDKADHDIRLKSTKLGLELRGLLQRGNRVNVGIGGNAQIAVGLPWSPSPAEDNSVQSAVSTDSPNEQSNSLSTHRSTIEGTGSGRGAATHGRSNKKSRAAVPVEHMSSGRGNCRRPTPIEHMSLLQLKNVPAEVRAAELERRLLLRTKNNPNVRKHVSKNHRAYTRGCDCKSGKCGKCRECKRRAKLRLP